MKSNEYGNQDRSEQDRANLDMLTAVEHDHAADLRFQTVLRKTFDDRELRLIANARAYIANDPAGLPGHNLLLIIDKLYKYLYETR